MAQMKQEYIQKFDESLKSRFAIVVVSLENSSFDRHRACDKFLCRFYFPTMEEVILREVSLQEVSAVELFPAMTLADVMTVLEKERLSQYATANWLSHRHAQIPAIRNLLPPEPSLIIWSRKCIDSAWKLLDIVWKRLVQAQYRYLQFHHQFFLVTYLLTLKKRTWKN